MVTLLLHTDYGQRKATLPESWDELKPKQYLGLLSILSEKKAHEQYIYQAVALLTDWSPWLLKQLGAGQLQEQVYPLLDWLNTEEIDITKQHLPSIGGLLHRWYGPDSGLANLDFEEWDNGEFYFHRWQTSKEDADLYRFIAVIYRKQKNGKRILFDGDAIDEQAQLMSRAVPKAQAMGIVVWWRGCRRKMEQAYPRLFPQGEGGEAPDYFAIMRQIAAEGAYGSFEQVLRMNVWLALKEMDTAIEEEQKRKQEQHAAQRLH